MTCLVRATLAAALMSGAVAIAAAAQTAPVQQPDPATTTPAQPAQAPEQQTQPPAPATPAPQTPSTPPVAVPPVAGTPGAPLASRSFTAPMGLLIQPVRPERVADFETFLAYVRDALAKSTNPTVRKQATGWEFTKAAEPGPNGVVLYTFLINPTVPKAEYAFGTILAEVYTDAAQLTEIWNLYTGSVPSGPSVLNLTPLPLVPPAPIATPPSTPPSETPAR